MDVNEMADKLTGQGNFVWLSRSATLEQAERIRVMNLDGVGVLPANRRFYPGGTTAAHVLGFTGLDGKGLEGLEYYYDERLTGDPIRILLERDARGNAIFVNENEDYKGLLSREESEEETSANPFKAESRGANLELTIVRPLQFLVESELGKGVEKAGAKSGCALVMEPETGRILAMASWPIYDPNEFGKYEQESYRNKCVTMAYEPGSTFKAFTVAAAIEEGVVTPRDNFFCENGSYLLGGSTIRDISKHGWLGIEDIMVHSSNIGASKIGEKMGKERMHRAYRAFGFGEKTGIDFPGEASGLLRPYKKWSQVAVGTISFGQGVAVTPLQMVAALGAIANGGTLMKPYLVERATLQDGTIVDVNGPTEVRKVISEKTARTLASFMKEVVSERGTGKNAMVPGFSVAGKTGTAQKAKERSRGYADGKYIASFMGFIPADRPRMAMIVVIDEPQLR